jgi:hypothetical protein
MIDDMSDGLQKIMQKMNKENELPVWKNSLMFKVFNDKVLQAGVKKKALDKKLDNDHKLVDNLLDWLKGKEDDDKLRKIAITYCEAVNTKWLSSNTHLVKLNSDEGDPDLDVQAPKKFDSDDGAHAPKLMEKNSDDSDSDSDEGEPDLNDQELKKFDSDDGVHAPKLMEKNSDSSEDWTLVHQDSQNEWYD